MVSDSVAAPQWEILLPKQRRPQGLSLQGCGEVLEGRTKPPPMGQELNPGAARASPAPWGHRSAACQEHT